MTGIRDGGPSSRRRPSAGHTSPPNHYGKTNDFTVIGTVVGYSAENNSAKRLSKRPKPDVVLLSDDESKGGHITKKARERTSAEVLSKASPQPGSVVSRMKKSSDTQTTERCSSTNIKLLNKTEPVTEDLINSGRNSVSSVVSGVNDNVQNGIGIFQIDANVTATFIAPFFVSIITSGPSKTQALGMGTFPRATLTKVRVGKQEFMDPEMAVQFGPDRIIIDIGMSVTKIPHAEIKIVEFFITDDNPTKLLQINTSGRLPATSNLAPFYDPTPNSSGARKIILYSNSSSSIFLDFCTKLKKSDRIRVTTMTLFVYPFKSSAKSKSIAVRQQDVGRLDDDEFLNDTLIELGLKYVHTKVEISNKIRAAETYIFNSFFYERLISGSSKESIISYDAVKSWTNKVDLFSMKYIIVPIHENMHWYLAIIVNPHLLLREVSPSSTNSSPMIDSPDSSSQGEQGTNGESAGDSDAAKSPRSSTPSILGGPDTLLDQLLNRRRTELASLPRRSTRSTPAVPIDVEESTMILVMDSLGGQHSSVFKTLRAYLQQELLARKNITKTLGPKEVLARYATKNKTDGTTFWELPRLPKKRQDYRDLVEELMVQYKLYQEQMAAVKP
ncbi:hypothetical protein BG003_008488 [Podila horticola]|nr:hypothetical protein BG003_008488 [Podila horticola]